MALAQEAVQGAPQVGWARATLNWFFSKRSLPIWGLLAVVTLAFWPTYLYWWGIWTADHSPFGYGYLVPPVILFLIWSRRDQINAEPKRMGNLLILIPIVLAVVIHCAALIARVNILQSFSFFILTMSVPYLIWGGGVYRHIWGALAYTATMLPWPPQIYGKLLLPSQEISTRIAVKMMRLVGLSPEVSGTMVWTGRYEFEVAAACSGLTIIFPVMAIVILSIMMVRAPAWKLVLLLLLAVPLAVFSNAIRILTIALIGEYWGGATADSLHDPSGVAAVIFASILLTVIMSWMKCMDYKPEYMPNFPEPEEEAEEPK